MPDFPAFEVALALIFVFLVLSLVCSAIMETLSSVFAWRAAYLKKGLQSLLDDDTRDKVLTHPLVNPLFRSARGELPAAVADTKGVRKLVGWFRRERYPSYLPSRAVVSALLDIDAAGAARAAGHTLDDAIAAIGEDDENEVRRALGTLLVEVKQQTDKAEEQVVLFRKAAEAWYDDTMQRVSGWYRRRVQLVLWCIAIAVAVVLNVDTINLTRVLWNDETVRAAVVAQAEQAAAQGEEVAAAQDLEGLGIPLGWTFEDGNPQDLPSSWQGIVSKLIGLFLTAAALSLGAPFWFDLLGKVARLRSTGVPPKPTPAPGS